MMLTSCESEARQGSLLLPMLKRTYSAISLGCIQLSERLIWLAMVMRSSGS